MGRDIRYFSHEMAEWRSGRRTREGTFKFWTYQPHAIISTLCSAASLVRIISILRTNPALFSSVGIRQSVWDRYHYSLDDQQFTQPQVIPHIKQASAQLFLRPQLVSYREHGDKVNKGKRIVTHFLTPIVICNTGNKRNCIKILLLFWASLSFYFPCGTVRLISTSTSHIFLMQIL